jgi:hypothetical protein
MAEVTLFADRNFSGWHTHVFESVSDLRQINTIGSGMISGNVQGGNWNDKVSSFVVISGEWRFFKDTNFQNQYGKEDLTPPLQGILALGYMRGGKTGGLPTSLSHAIV